VKQILYIFSKEDFKRIEMLNKEDLKKLKKGGFMFNEWDKCSKKDARIIHKIGVRAKKELLKKRDLIDIEMDVMATHIKLPLRLTDFLKADKFNFARDIYGITDHIDRDTGKMNNCFLPRFARQ